MPLGVFGEKRRRSRTGAELDGRFPCSALFLIEGSHLPNVAVPSVYGAAAGGGRFSEATLAVGGGGLRPDAEFVAAAALDAQHQRRRVHAQDGKQVAQRLGPRVERRRVRGRGARALAQIEFEAWRIAGASRSARPPLGRRSLLLRLRLGDADFRLAFHLVVRRAPSRAALGFGQRRRRRRRSSGGAGAFDNVGRDGQRTHKRRPRALPKGRPSAD
mmetsp:Transcript_22648/g.80831  ORF Transcript_22648/g.80831 Transcript_22648/m.80831 type:complete len:216 (+) Transcript_22648:1451-2098(+)